MFSYNQQVVSYCLLQLQTLSTQVTDVPSSPFIHSSGNYIKAALTTGSHEMTGRKKIYISIIKNPVAFIQVLEAQESWIRCFCNVYHSWLITYPHAAHLPYVPKQGVCTGRQKSLPQPWCTMIFHFPHFCCQNHACCLLRANLLQCGSKVATWEGLSSPGSSS